MPITASINRHPETENQSETAAPHPEEMKATFDLTIGNAVSVKATVRTTPAGLVAAALLAAAVLIPAALLAKRLLEERTSSAIGKLDEGQAARAEKAAADDRRSPVVPC